MGLATSDSLAHFLESVKNLRHISHPVRVDLRRPPGASPATALTRDYRLADRGLSEGPSDGDAINGLCRPCPVRPSGGSRRGVQDPSVRSAVRRLGAGARMDRRADSNGG
ncbi:hypothetical protein Arub01_53970 [Actinomadura rubrobrunea]|uniref:Uncharacterized protein n=1 Tax=Actinomadura rubrobrunea TaxID=115335 RepID=A0A9W6PZC4_9ACTN|nr:hypothetical protein Arub01_53970 [Actinomadura rubrobrunea]